MSLIDNIKRQIDDEREASHTYIAMAEEAHSEGMYELENALRAIASDENMHERTLTEFRHRLAVEGFVEEERTGLEWPREYKNYFIAPGLQMPAQGISDYKVFTSMDAYEQDISVHTASSIGEAELWIERLWSGG